MKQKVVFSTIAIMLLLFLDASAQKKFTCDLQMPGGLGASGGSRMSYNFSSKKAKIIIQKDNTSNLYSIVDSSGTVYIDNLQSCYKKISGNYIIQDNNGKWGVLDKSIEEIIPPMYDDLMYETLQPGFNCIVKLDDKFGLVDSVNAIKFPIEYDQIRAVTSRLLVLIKGENKELYHIGWDKVVDIKDYCFKIIKSRKKIKETFYIQSEGRVGVMNFDGKIIVEPKYEDVTQIVRNEITFYSIFHNDKNGILDVDGNMIIEPKYDFLTAKGENQSAYYSIYDDYNYGVLDTLGNVVFEPIYRALKSINKPENFEDYAWGIATDEKVSILYKGEYTDVDFRGMSILGDPSKSKVIKYKVNDSLGIYNFETNETIALPIYVKFYPRGDSLIMAKSDWWGVLSNTGEQLTECIYSDIPMSVHLNDRTYWKVKSKGLSSLLDENFEEVIKPKYEIIGSFKDGYSPVKLNQKWGLINDKFDLIIEPKYDLFHLKDGEAKVNKDEKCYYIDMNEKYIRDCEK